MSLPFQRYQACPGVIRMSRDIQLRHHGRQLALRRREPPADQDARRTQLSPFTTQLISPFTMAKSTKKTKYYTHEEALALILASSEDSEDSQYDSEIEEMFKQQLDEVLDR